VVGQHLFKTYVGSTVRALRSNPHLHLSRMAPRYYTELAPLAYVPGLREFACWNCALLIERKV
jgi:hypothetical protein